MKQLVLLGGAPGVGKSTTARLLAPSVGAVIEIDTLWSFHGVPDYLDGEQLARAMKCAAACVEHMPGVVLLVSPWSEEQVRAFSWDVPVEVAMAFRRISLTCRASTLESRLACRVRHDTGAYNDVDKALELNAEHARNDLVEDVDTTGLAPSYVASVVLKRLSRDQHDQRH